MEAIVYFHDKFVSCNYYCSDLCFVFVSVVICLWKEYPSRQCVYIVDFKLSVTVPCDE